MYLNSKLTYQFLKKEYIQNEKSMEKIGKEVGCNTTKIWSYLKKYSIKARKVHHCYNKNIKSKINAKFLKKEYIKNDKTMTQIGKKVGCCAWSIWCYLKKFQIKARGNTNYIDGRTLKKYYCVDCKKKQIGYISWQYKNKRCLSCSKTGILNPVYKGENHDRRYPSEFNKTLKDKIKKRDNFTCQNCAITEKQHLLLKKRILAVHHINYIKKDCIEKNLITLCHGCNMKANYNISYWFAYFTFLNEHPEYKKGISHE